MEETPQAVKLGGLWQSRFLVSVIAFVSVIAGFTWLIPKACRPLETPPTFFAAKPYVHRAEKYFYSDDNPEIILMGSSLVLRPTFECDRKFEKLLVPENEEEARAFKHRYTKSEHLKRLMESRLPGSYNVVNVGVPSCMASDYLLILQKVMDFGKHPHLIILAVAPRDFLDNKYPDPKLTPNTEHFLACSPARQWMRHPIACANFLRHFFPPLAFADNLLDTVIVRAVSYRYAFEQSSDGPAHLLIDAYRRSLLNTSSSKVTACEHPATSASAKRYIDLDVYNWCYNPPNLEQLRQQFGYLEEFVALSYRSNIPVVLVDMPITPENQALIRADVLKTYKEMLKEVATERSNVMLVDASRTSGCTKEDFVDSVHLDGSGGHKCFECITKAISANSLLRAKLCAVRSAPEL